MSLLPQCAASSPCPNPWAAPAAQFVRPEALVEPTWCRCQQGQPRPPPAPAQLHVRLWGTAAS
eukprot:7853523-Alexandrium_andersonii.AAC.1